MDLFLDCLFNIWQMVIVIFFLYLFLFPIGWYFFFPSMSGAWMLLYIPHLALAKALSDNSYL